MSSAGLAEIVLIVTDVERSARFYREVVGLTPDRPIENGWAWFWTGGPALAQRVALHDGPLLFEKFPPLPEGTRWGRVHYAFNVPRERLGGSVEHVRKSGAEVHGPARLEWMSADAYYLFDPDGNMLEFWSPDPRTRGAIHES